MSSSIREKTRELSATSGKQIGSQNGKITTTDVPTLLKVIIPWSAKRTLSPRVIPVAESFKMSTIATKRSPISISPARERCGPRASLTRYEMGDVSDSLARVERETEKNLETEGNVKAAETPNNPTSAVTDSSTSGSTDSAEFEGTPVVNDEPAEPPRRRYARRSSATMYNLHNYAQQVQNQQGDWSR